MTSKLTISPKINCECGCSISKTSIYSHRKSQKHSILLNFKNETVDIDNSLDNNSSYEHGADYLDSLNDC